MSTILYQSTAETNTNVPSELRTIKSPEISYEVATLEHSQPYFTKKAPKNNSKLHTIEPGSTTDMAFVFDPLTYNLSDFVLHYKADFTSTVATGGDALTGYYTYAFADVVPIQTVELKGQNTGTVLARINNASAYLTLISKLEASKEKFLSRTASDANRPCQSDINVTYANLPTAAPYNEFKYVETGIPHPAALPTTTHTIANRYLRFGDIFKYTALGLNKMWFPTEPLELTITWMASPGWMVESVHATIPSSTPLATIAPIALSDVYIDMCHEQSGTVVDRQCRELANKGMVLYSPTVTSESRAMSDSSEGSVTYAMSSAVGKKLSKVILVPALAAPVPNLRHSYANVNGARVEHYQTRFNSVNIQPVAVQVKDSQSDWILNRKLLERSAMWNIDVYRRNWCIIDDFSGYAKKESVLPFEDDSIFVGKDVNPRDNYEISAKVGISAINMIAYFVGSQKIIVKPEGLLVVY